MAQHTAVELLVKEISTVLGPIKTEPMQDLLLVDIIKKANKMFEEQIKNAYIVGSVDELPYDEDAQQYYNKTYGK